MARLSLWQNSGAHSKDYAFVDRSMSEYIGISGCPMLLHLYLGPQDQSTGQDSPTTTTTIEDVLYLENRDRRYSDEVYELRGLYTMSEVDWNLLQFAAFMNNDTIFIDIHINDTLARIGRKPISGDVIELPHLRDDALLDPDASAINKFYVIDEVTRGVQGYSVTWLPHLYRLKLVPMTASQEFSDILQTQATDPFGFATGGTISDIMSTLGTDMGINQAIVDSAKASVSARNFQTQQFYVVPGDGGPSGSQNPWIFAGDGVPPDGAVLTGSGTSFPLSPSEGEYYLRVDYQPRTLFLYTSGKWVLQEQDFRQSDWSVAHRLLQGFINQTAVNTMPDGSSLAERQGLYQAIKPRADL